MAIMDPENWPAAWQHADGLEPYRRGMLADEAACRRIVELFRADEPATLCSLGGGDLGWWCYDELAVALLKQRADQPHDVLVGWLTWLEQLAASSGLHRSDRATLAPLFEEAVHNGPNWGVQYRWNIAETVTRIALQRRGVVLAPDQVGFMYRGRYKTKIDANAVYGLHQRQLFAPLLARRRLAIIGARAPAFAELIQHPLFGVADNNDAPSWSVVTTLVPPGMGEPKADWWAANEKKLFAADWDLLLCSAGGLATIICEAARRRDRHALDIGQLDWRLLDGEPLAR